MSTEPSLKDLEVLILNLQDGRTVIGYNVEENEDNIAVYYPVVLVFSDQYSLNTTVLGYKYSPFAKNNVVMFNKFNLIGYSSSEDRIKDYYHKLVLYYQNIKTNVSLDKKIESETTDYDTESELEIDETIKSKYLH